MTKKTRINLFIPLILLLTLLLDGVIATIFSSQLYTSTTDMVSRLILVCLIFFSFYVERNPMILFGIIFGLLYDSYYVGILGVYASLFPIVVYLCDKMKKIFNPNMLVLFLVGIIQLSLVEFLLFGFYTVLDLANIDMSMFLANRLGPTLLLNGIYMLLLYFPLRKAATKITQD